MSLCFLKGLDQLIEEKLGLNEHERVSFTQLTTSLLLTIQQQTDGVQTNAALLSNLLEAIIYLIMCLRIPKWTKSQLLQG